MSISTIDDIVDGLANHKKHIEFARLFTTVDTAGQYQSGWQATGLPDSGAIPAQYDSGGPYICTSGTVGALPLPNITNQAWLAGLSVTSTVASTVYLADRLWHANMGFAATTYTITTPGDLPSRITDNGVGCEIFIEQFSTGGSSTGTWTVNYIDSDNQARSSQINVITTPLVGLLRYVPHAQGARGVKQITSVVKSNTGTSGSFGIVIVKRILEIPIPHDSANTKFDWAQTALAKIPTDACLFFYHLATVTTASTVIGSIDIIDK